MKQLTLNISLSIPSMIWFLLFIVRSVLILEFSLKARRWWKVMANLCRASWRRGRARSAFLPFSRHHTSRWYHSSCFSGSQLILYCSFSTLNTCNHERWLFVYKLQQSLLLLLSLISFQRVEMMTSSLCIMYILFVILFYIRYLNTYYPCR